MGPRLVLASRSPQRRAILEQLEIPFEVIVPKVAESAEGEPRELVAENATRKAAAVRSRAGGGRLVLGVDTAVVLDGRPYGKPRDEGEARDVLERLSGRAHEVWSGIALLTTLSPEPPEALASLAQGVGRLRTAAALTEVRFRRLDAPLLDWYLASGEWHDRAGGYAIQGRGAALVEGVVGDYSNVVGLPVAELVRLEPGLLLG